MEYTIEKPKISILIYLLGIVIILSLIGLGIAAYTAFKMTTDIIIQALLFATIIEVTGIVEAIALIRSKNWVGILGMVFILAISGTYNYVQAEKTGKFHGITDQWQLTTLALGPLLATTILSMTVGKELRTHDENVKKWEKDRQKWHTDKALRDADEEKNLEEKSRQDRLAQEKMRMQVELEKERIRAESDRLAAIEMERIRTEAERKTEMAKARLEAKKRKILQNFVQESEFSDTIWINDWRKLPSEDKLLIASMTTAEIREKYEVSERTALNWYKRARGILPENNNGHQQD
jgi:hypothetical protein